MSGEQPQPLAGLRVLDLSRFIAGPMCAQILGDMGATVIKVERPGGEDARRNRPFAGEHSIYAMIYNRNKHGITLNTRAPEAVDLLERLIVESDVIVENYRPGTMESMGLSFERIQEINPRAVLTSISGFGQSGPNSHRAMFDAIAQAASGLMSLTGGPEDPPLLTGTYIADYLGAFHAVMGTMFALWSRESTGVGQHVDIAAVDALFGILNTHPSDYAMNGHLSERTGSRDQVTMPANAYPCADGHVYLHAGTDPLFPRLCRLMGREELAQDPRFVGQAERLEHRDELETLVTGWTSQLPCAEVEAQLIASGIPASTVLTVAEAVDSEQVRAREMMIDMVHPVYGLTRLPGIPIKLSQTPGSARKPPPLPGEDNAAIYGELLGLGEAELARLRSAGVI
ncbi:CaiB/BaiF CoA transferase family protein [Brevibacterium oceani]|uniref:CaiB/BaiF CoA transferase family protein n=1 Tax=Brevibacterium oceani TaxID=358099 RepID=UPI001B337DEB|nr:CoA transferase [Brevibacterium oceani]